MAKRLLVTGGAGFIGSHICDQFLEHGWVVEVLDDLSRGRRENVAAGVALHIMDIRSPDAARLVREGAYDTIVHLAAQMDVRKSVADPALDASINVLGTLNLLEGVRASTTAKSCRIVFASTGGALYGELVSPPNTETIPKDPESPYAIAKLSVEYYLAYYARVHGLDYVALRFGNVYGPRQDPHGEAGVVAIFCGRILDRRPLTVFGDGQQTRDYVYVGDVARAASLAATTTMVPVANLDVRAFNIGTGVGTSVNELAKTLLQVSGSNAPIEYAPPRPGEQLHSYLEVAKAAEILAWKPTISLESGLRKSFEWFSTRHREAVTA